jgi:hypothetical protein
MIRHLSRLAATSAILLLLAACQGDTTSPSESSDAGGTRSAGQTPAAAPDDTAHTTPPPAPPASAIHLTVYVGIASPGPDTLHSTPAANARVAVLSRTFTRSTAPDTVTVTETLVASGITDVLGTASFDNLPAAGYRLEAVVDGRPGSPASIQIAPPYASTVATSIIIRPSP